MWLASKALLASRRGEDTELAHAGAMLEVERDVLIRTYIEAQAKASQK